MDKRILLVIVLSWVFSLSLLTFQKVVCATSNSVEPSYNTNATGLRANVGDTILFTNTTDPKIGEITEYKWNFGDGQYEWKEKSEHVFTESGNYPVSLTVRGSFGYKIKRDTLKISPSVGIKQSIGNASILGEGVVKQGTSISLHCSVDAASYTWSVQNDAQAKVIQQGKSASFIFTTPGSKSIVLALHNPEQVIHKDIVVEAMPIKVNTPPTVTKHTKPKQHITEPNAHLRYDELPKRPTSGTITNPNHK